MRTLTTVAIAVCLSASGMSADASASWCFPLPFPGFWGVGYGPGPPGGPYCCGYAPVAYVGVYAVGYRGCSPCELVGCPSPCCMDCTTGCRSVCGSASGKSIRSDKVLSPVRDPGFRNGADRTSSDIDNEKWNKRYDKPSDTEEGRSPTEHQERERPGFLDQDRNSPDHRDSNGDFRLEKDDSGPETEAVDFAPSFEATESDAGNDDFGPDTGDNLESGNHRTRRPALDAPIDDSEKPGVDDGEGDVLVPAPGSEKSTQSRLFRGALTNVQARTGRTESATRLRLAGQTRRYHESHPVHWSGRDNKRQPALQWIEAPARDGRIRL